MLKCFLAYLKRLGFREVCMHQLNENTDFHKPPRPHPAFYQPNSYMPIWSPRLTPTSIIPLPYLSRNVDSVTVLPSNSQPCSSPKIIGVSFSYAHILLRTSNATVTSASGYSKEPENANPTATQPANTGSGSPCPYHAAIVNLEPVQDNNEYNPMDRFLGEGPNEQPAVFIRDDTGQVSLSKGCTCPVPKDFASN
jgi:hypothetical protein